MGMRPCGGFILSAPDLILPNQVGTAKRRRRCLDNRSRQPDREFQLSNANQNIQANNGKGQYLLCNKSMSKGRNDATE